jgi:hypothetical protein
VREVQVEFGGPQGTCLLLGARLLFGSLRGLSAFVCHFALEKLLEVTTLEQVILFSLLEKHVKNSVRRAKEQVFWLAGKMKSDPPWARAVERHQYCL